MRYIQIIWKTVASASSAMAMVRIERVPSLISTTRSPWWYESAIKKACLLRFYFNKQACMGLNKAQVHGLVLSGFYNVNL